jgi:hypothetical protein
LLGAILLASTFLFDGLATRANFEGTFYIRLALVALLAGFVFGSLATGLALMLVGAALARLVGDQLEGVKGIAIALTPALAMSAALYVLVTDDPFSADAEPFVGVAAVCFALPAALLYRRQVLLERAFERP